MSSCDFYKGQHNAHLEKPKMNRMQKTLARTKVSMVMLMEHIQQHRVGVERDSDHQQHR